jgi:hypothetical protein
LFPIKAQATQIVVSAEATQEAQVHTGARSLLQANTVEGSNFNMVINFFVIYISVLINAHTPLHLFPLTYLLISRLSHINALWVLMIMIMKNAALVKQCHLFMPFFINILETYLIESFYVSACLKLKVFVSVSPQDWTA